LTDPTDTTIKNKMSKEWATNWANKNLRRRAKELRKLSARARRAYTKDPMRSVCLILADAYADAADLIGSKIKNL